MAHSPVMTVPARRLLAACLLGACLLAGACNRADAPSGVTIGTGATAEQRLLAALTVEALQRAGIAVDGLEEVGDTRDLHEAARRGEIDLFWDYSGAALSLELLRQQAPPTAPEESFERAAEADQERDDLRWLGPTGANATLALFVRPGDVPEAERTLTLLSRRLSEGGHALCADREFIDRPEGLASLAEEYSISLEALRPIPASEDEATALVAGGECFAGLATATAGTARNAGLVPVADDLQVFPAFVVAPVVRGPTQERIPSLSAALELVVAQIDSTERLRELNARVESGIEPQTVAEEALGGASPAPPSPA